MSKKNDFTLGDRVQAPDKKQGTVKYVGKVHWTKGIWVGVEMDDPVGKHDGMEKKKRYFKCAPNHGIMQKASYWSKASDKKGSSKKDTVTTSKKSKGSSKSKKGGDSGGGKSKDKALSPEPTPEPKRVHVDTSEKSLQTDPPEEEMSKQYLCKLITHMMADQLDKAKNEKEKAQKMYNDMQKDLQSAKNEKDQLAYDANMKAQEIEKLKDEIEELKLTNEDLQVQNELYKLDIDEANEKVEDNFLSFRSSLNMDEQKQAEILRENELLKQTIENLFKSGIDAISQKDKAIFDLTMDAGYMGTLGDRVKQLLGVEREVVQLRSEVKELRDANEALQDADNMVKELTEANNELEGELQDWRDYVVDVDAERQVLEDLHTENEALIQELKTYGQRVSADFSALQKKYAQKDVEISDLQKELFKLRNEMAQINSAQQSGLEFAEITSAVEAGGAGGGDSVTTGGMAGAPLSNAAGSQSGHKKMQIIINENVSLKAQLAQLRNILIRQIGRQVEGRADYVHRNVLSLYFPKTLEIDNTGIDALKILQRLLYKAGIARDLLERFYADPSSSALKNPNLARQAHWLCPLILEQENYVRALQKGLLMCKEEGWKPVVNTFGKLNSLEQPYSILLEHIDKATLEEYNDTELSNNKKVLSEFVKKHFASLDIEIDQKDDERVEKPRVLLMMSETHYRFQSLSLRLNEFNAKMHKLVHAPSQTTKTITEQIMGSSEDNKDEEATDDMKDDESKTDEPSKPILIQETVNEAISSLKIGVIEKMFKLRNTLLDHLKEIIDKSQPIDLGYRTKYITANVLSAANRTQVKFGQLKVCKSDARKAVARIEEMLKKLTQVTAAMAPKDRISKINRILEDEEEHNAEGLLNVLDAAYSNVRSVKTIVDSTVNSTLRNTDELPDLSSEERRAIETNNEFPVWEVKAAAIRDKIDEAGQIRQDMERMKSEMSNQKSQVFENHKLIDEQRNIIATIQDQRDKEAQKVTALAKSEERTAFLEKENERLVGSNQKLEKENKEALEKIRENEELIKKYKKSMEKIKDKQLLGSKPSTRTLESLDSTFGRARGSSRGDRSEIGHRSLSPRPKSPASQRRSFAVGGGANALPSLTNTGSNKGNEQALMNAASAMGGGAMASAMMGRAFLGVGAANALSYYDEEDMSYSELLQETIQTLRRKVSQLTMKNKLTNCQLNLKPLPIVSIKDILNDGASKEAKKESEEKNETKEKKKRTRIVKKKVTRRVKREKKTESKETEDDDTAVTTEKKDENEDDNDNDNNDGNESEYDEIEVETDVEEEVTDDESEENSFDFAKKLEQENEKAAKEKSEAMTNEIKTLTNDLNNLRATPAIVDIAKKSFGAQDVIARQFKLRDIHLKYLDLKEQIRKTEEALGTSEDNGNATKKLGSVLGKVSIPDSLQSSLAPLSQRVLIAPQKLDEFKQSFL